MEAPRIIHISLNYKCFTLDNDILQNIKVTFIYTDPQKFRSLLKTGKYHLIGWENGKTNMPAFLSDLFSIRKHFCITKVSHHLNDPAVYLTQPPESKLHTYQFSAKRLSFAFTNIALRDISWNTLCGMFQHSACRVSVVIAEELGTGLLLTLMSARSGIT